MDTTLLTDIVTNSAFGILFVYLLLDTRKENAKRESEYQKTIELLGDKILTKLEENGNNGKE